MVRSGNTTAASCLKVDLLCTPGRGGGGGVEDGFVNGRLSEAEVARLSLLLSLAEEVSLLLIKFSRENVPGRMPLPFFF